MHFDALTLACVADELRSDILGGRVQQALLQPDAESIGLEVYAQRERQISARVREAGAGRVHLSSVKLRRGAAQETPLLLLAAQVRARRRTGRGSAAGRGRARAASALRPSGTRRDHARRRADGTA